MVSHFARIKRKVSEIIKFLALLHLVFQMQEKIQGDTGSDFSYRQYIIVVDNFFFAFSVKNPSKHAIKLALKVSFRQKI